MIRRPRPAGRASGVLGPQPGRVTDRLRGPLRALALGIGLGTAATVLAGCGIRSTEVPVDDGPAPSRATCTVPQDNSGGTEVYLVCGSRVEAVRRSVPLPVDEIQGRVAVARALLDELRTTPAQEEQTAGFFSLVPADLTVSGPGPDDPEPLLRLSQRPGELPAYALVQIICTFAQALPIADGQSVLLAGPSDVPDSHAESYACSTAMLHNPDSAHTVGTAF